MKQSCLPTILLLGCLCCTVNASAGVIDYGTHHNYGSNLLDAAGLAKLEGWLGEGSLKLTNIFDHNRVLDNMTSVDFHTAADGMGRTFVVMRATDDGVTNDIGGYDYQSWASSGGSYGYDMTGFLFNLDRDLVYRPTTETLAGLFHAMYTLEGPSYGSGRDLAVFSDLNSGYSYLWSYGTYANGRENSNLGKSLVSGVPWDGFNMTISDLEVFTIANYTAPNPTAATPEPSTMLLMGLGAAGVAWMRRRKMKNDN